MTIMLRPLADGDLDTLFVWESDPRAVELAAFTRADPADRAAFDAHYVRVRANPENTLLAIEEDGEFVGTIGSYTMEGEREVTYWIDPARWGRGIASRARCVPRDRADETAQRPRRRAQRRLGERAPR